MLAHSFKHAAALQAVDLDGSPRLLRIATRGGHGAGKPAMTVIEDIADLWAFAARWTGLHLTAPSDNHGPQAAIGCAP